MAAEWHCHRQWNFLNSTALHTHMWWKMGVRSLYSKLISSNSTSGRDLRTHPEQTFSNSGLQVPGVPGGTLGTAIVIKERKGFKSK